MIEYPTIQNSSKAPRKPCIAFEKFDGSNFRAKWTQKNGFCLFGTRTQLIDESTEFFGKMVRVFNQTVNKPLNEFLKKEYRNEREVICFGEFFGDNSFAGRHENEDQKIVIFDILVGHKPNSRKFIRPQDFIKKLKNVIELPRVVYQGNLNESFIQDVRDDKFDTFEGVICKGTESVGNAVGGVWMCKIKTNKYFEKLKGKFQEDWEKYGE